MDLNQGDLVWDWEDHVVEDASSTNIQPHFAFQVEENTSSRLLPDQSFTFSGDGSFRHGSQWEQSCMQNIDQLCQLNGGPSDNHVLNYYTYQDPAPPLPIEGLPLQEHNPQSTNDSQVDHHVNFNGTARDMFSPLDNISSSQSGDKSALDTGLSEKLKSKKALKEKRPRLPCPHLGCKETFPRKYEQLRHCHNIHDQNVKYFCPAYGCNRIEKPYHRWDKFKEHTRKHATWTKVLCFMDDCYIEPCTEDELMVHLVTHHHHDHSTQENFDMILRVLNLDPVAFKVEKLRHIGKDNCPLNCGFWVSNEHHDMQKHLETHGLSDRSKSHAAILAEGFNPNFGPATCPLCGHSSFYVLGLVDHILGSHAKSERADSIAMLSRLLGPFLSIKNFIAWPTVNEFVAEINEYNRQQQLSP